MSLAAHHRSWYPACLHKAGDVLGVAGQDAVTRTGEQGHRRVNHIRRTGSAKQHTGLAAGPFINGTHLHCAEEAGQRGLPPGAIPPDLGDDDGVAPQADVPLLRDPESGHHLPIAALDSQKRARVENEGAHAAG
ncbi:hypothetical protein [Frankia canadensis]|uniref:hypothetical protein n=1 Tax=Frankia canadensis TaxID=1836972 RepID=UPI001A9C8238|nr:hypothetical protein [Frankia canadensis]